MLSRELPTQESFPCILRQTRTWEEKRFGRADKDKNGKITEEELLTPRKRRLPKDLDHNGQLAFNEYPAKTIDKFDGADDDHSGTLTAPKPRAHPARCSCQWRFARKMLSGGMRLRAVTYSSFASAGFQPAELQLILTTARVNNARDGISGLLMFNGAAFVQVVEGPATAIDRLVMHLANDTRHCQMEICDERKLDLRIFPSWTMGYARMEGGWLEGQYDIAEALSHEMPKPIRELLMSMASTLPFA